jgi:hypothetical protein
MTATIINFPSERWQRFKTSPCPKHPEGRRWQHGEAVGDGTAYCRAADIFCSHDAEHRALCSSEIGLRPDGEPLQHGDHVPGGKRFCERKKVRCECGDRGVSICASVMPKRRTKKGKKS